MLVSSHRVQELVRVTVKARPHPSAPHLAGNGPGRQGRKHVNAADAADTIQGALLCMDRRESPDATSDFSMGRMGQK